jgi:hypothetical protein
MRIRNITKALFFLIGGIWVVFGIVGLIRAGDGAFESSNAAWIIASLMFANACVLIWIGWRLKEGAKRTYMLGIAVLATNILLTLTDEFGFFDLVTLLIDITLVLLLIVDHSTYTSPKGKTTANI